ncbi:MAG TPA: YkgJ family cysteine cluster protein [Terracidiphilus sp.]|nr:YkgJ family cysteine cluster protein [Terracidiphilus sp.]
MPNPSADSPSPTVKATFSLPIGGVYLQASAQLPAGQTTLTQLLPVIQNLENVILGKVAEEAAEGGSPISCRAGCGACCRQMVPVSLFEAEALTDWIRSLPEERQKELAERFHHALSGLRDAGVIDKILRDEWVLEEGRTTQLAVDYFHAHVACPFLENESCSIHPIRPLACREYLVVSPPALCEDPSIHDINGVQLPLKLSRVLHSFGQDLEHDPRGWIPLVFLLAWGRSGARPGDYVAGTGEEVLRKFLERLHKMNTERTQEETEAAASANDQNGGG